MKDIKNLLELLTAVELLAVTGAKVAKDKEVNKDDLVHVVTLAKNFELIANAVKDVDQLDEELKDLDEAELIAIVSKLFMIVKAVKAELE